MSRAPAIQRAAKVVTSRRPLGKVATVSQQVDPYPIALDVQLHSVGLRLTRIEYVIGIFDDAVQVHAGVFIPCRVGPEPRVQSSHPIILVEGVWILSLTASLVGSTV